MSCFWKERMFVKELFDTAEIRTSLEITDNDGDVTICNKPDFTRCYEGIETL